MNHDHTFFLQNEVICAIQQLREVMSPEFFIELEKQEDEMMTQYSRGRDLDEKRSSLLRQSINMTCSMVATSQYMKGLADFKIYLAESDNQKKLMAKTKGTYSTVKLFIQIFL